MIFLGNIPFIPSEHSASFQLTSWLVSCTYLAIALFVLWYFKNNIIYMTERLRISGCYGKIWVEWGEK